MSRTRTVLGFAIAPLVPGALLAALLLGLDDRELAQTALLASVYFGYAIALVIGIPLFIVLRHLGQNSLLSYIATGAVLGAFLYAALPAVIDVLIRLQGVDGGHTEFSLSVLPVAMACASVAAIAFWLIVRPDRSAVS